MMGKREALHAILNGQRADRIPVIMNAFSLPVARYGYTMAQVMQQPDKMVECMVGTRRQLGYDGLCLGVYSGITRQIAGHLPNSEGKIVGDGDDVIHSFEDIKKLKEFHVKKCPWLEKMKYMIDRMREEEPDEPIYVIVHTPSSVAFTLMGAKPAFKAMVKN